MKLVRVKLIGSGEYGDSYRVALPTYKMRELDEKKKYAIVEVPDDCYPPAPEDQDETVETHEVHGDVVTEVTDKHKQAAREFFDQKYREHAGEYSLDTE